MWTLYREPVHKDYHANLLSRSWFLATGCCLFAFIIPILVLFSIGYSWNTYELALITPVLTFQNYQATCLLQTGEATYDSSFNNELTTNSYKVYMSGGGEDQELMIYGKILSEKVSACTFQLYFKVTLDDRIPTIAVMPIHFYRKTENTALWLSSVKQWGTIQTSIAYPVPQSSVAEGDGLLYYQNSTQTLTMSDTHTSYAIHKNVSLNARVRVSQPSYSSTAGSMSYEGRFTVVGANVLREVSLLENLRSFVPFFIYLFILGWVFLSQPTVRWMLQNKIYRAKVRHHKVKVH